MTDQEIYDRIVTHLRKQWARSATPDGLQCLYRSTDGKMCAVGCLIPDDVYSPQMERWSVTRLTEGWSALRPLFGSNIMLLNRLQMIHDQYPLNKWEYKFEECARHFKLVYTKPEAK